MEEIITPNKARALITAGPLKLRSGRTAGPPLFGSGRTPDRTGSSGRTYRWTVIGHLRNRHLSNRGEEGDTFVMRLGTGHLSNRGQEGET